MKQWICIILVFLSLPIFAQTTDELIKQHVAAVGGEKAWASIKSIRVEGEVMMEGVTIKTTKQVIKGKGYRNDMVFEGKVQSLANNKFYVSIFKDKGWKYLPDSKNNQAEDLDQGEIAVYKDDMDYEDPFVFYKDKGLKISFLNTENILDEDYYKFSVTYPSGKQEYVYLWVKNLMIAKRVLANGDAEDHKNYEGYEKLPSGIYFPMSITAPIGEIKINKVLINPVIDEKIFLPSK